ncbi:MAG: acylphosphatase [Dehalococcoidia bacterium]|nr:acylphosphatase [Dehalococcoidia bacterium]
MTSSRPDEALRAVVHGRVQGVGFRAFVQRRALELGIKGLVRNMSDGRSVEVMAEGQRAALEALVAALKLGPSGAYIEKVELSWSEATGSYQGFFTG